jgi:predicted Zn-dependent protease
MIKLYPVNSDPRESRIRVFLKHNQDAKAKAEVDAILARRSQSYVGQFYTALLKSRAKDKRGAAQIIQTLPTSFVEVHPEYAVQMAQIAFDDGHDGTSLKILGTALAADPDMLDVRLKFAELRMAQDSPQGAMLVLGPVKDSTDPRVQKLLGKVRARITKDRAF